MKEIFERNGIVLTDEQENKFVKYRELLKEYNEKFNLTAITDDDGIAVKHFIDSVKGAPYLPEKGRIGDIGSGAGFPAVPLCIMGNEQQKFIMLDSLSKRVGFLNTVIKELGLTNAEAYHMRAEQEAIKHRGYYDCIVARAVAPLGVLCEYALPLLRCGGTLVAYKSEAVEEVKNAANALKVLGGEIVAADGYMLDGEFKRTFIVVEKKRSTPLRYPRGQNKPRNSPL